MPHSEIPVQERVIASLSYLSLGFIGFIWFCVNYFIIKKPMSDFLKCNIIQSFVLSIFYAILMTAYNILMGILFAIPFVGAAFYFIHNIIFATPIFFTLSLINFIILIFLAYLAIFPLFGKLPFIPCITQITKNLG